MGEVGLGGGRGSRWGGGGLGGEYEISSTPIPILLCLKRDQIGNVQFL